MFADLGKSTFDKFNILFVLEFDAEVGKLTLTLQYEH